MSNLSDLLPAGAAAKQLTFTDSGSGIATKKPVILNSDGTVTEVGTTTLPIAVGSAIDFSGGTATGKGYYASVCYDTANDKIFIAYRDQDNSSYGTGVVCTVSGTTLSVGTPVVFSSNSTSYTSCCFDSSNNKVFVAYQNSSAQGEAVVATISGTSVSYGSSGRIDGGGSNKGNYIEATYDANAGKVFTAYYDSYNVGAYGTVHTISGTGFSSGSPASFGSYYYPLGITYDSTAQKIISTIQTGVSTLFSVSVTISGTSWSNGTYLSIGPCNGNADVSYDPVQDKTLQYFNDATANTGKVAVLSLSGTTLSSGSQVDNTGSSEGYIKSVYNAASASHVIIWSTGSAGKARDVTISGTTPTLNTTTTDWSSDYLDYVGAAYDEDQKVTVIATANDVAPKCYAIAYQSTYSAPNLTAQAFVGVADSAISASAAGSVSVQGGTVSGVSSGTGVSAGTAVQYSASNLADVYAADSVYDSTNNKIVVVYDGAGSGAGYGIVGTISGTSVSYGSAVQFSGGNARMSQVTYDSTKQRVVVAYSDAANSGYLTAAVGTVSGTSISWGTPVVADSTVNDFYIGIDFDINAGKVLIIWKDNSTAYNYGIVGTVSGTSISFGTKATVDTSYGYQMIGGLTYDANAQKHLFFRPRTSGTVADGYVGTISGTSVSWGSATSATTTQSLSVGWGSYDSNAQKVVVTYRIGAGGMGSQVATISGTSVSFGTQVVVDASINPDFTTNYYDSTDQTIVAFGRATNYYGYIGTVSGTSISWSSASTLLLDAAFGYGLGTPAYDANADKGLILFANAGDSAAESAVTTAGALPLTTGTKYYVTTSGGFSSSADTPSVNAGLAISTTSLLLNGDS